MKVNIPRIVKPVALDEYAPELAGQCFHVWVNPPMEKLADYDKLVTDLQERELVVARKTLMPDGTEAPDAPKVTPLASAFEQVKRLLKIRKEQKPDGLAQEILTWYAELWSQGPESTHWTMDELRELEKQDPAFLSWMIARTWQARMEHVEHKKKS